MVDTAIGDLCDYVMFLKYIRSYAPT